jgi:anti-anti-sigma factor
MNNAPSLLVSVHDHAALVKVNGRASFSTSVSFKRLIGELRQLGFDHFILDLSECITMDSTFLGVLAGAALKMTEAPAAAGQQEPLRLLNPNQRVVDLLDNLGVSDLFQTLRCDPPREEGLQPAPEVTPSKEELSRACLEAHRTLMKLNPGNVPRFKDVTQFLAEDIKRLATEAKEKTTTPDDEPHGGSS